jgi:FkbM family methyltransferase
LTQSATHHPAILAVPRQPVMTGDGFAIDLVGARTRVEFFERLVPSGASGESASVTPPLPAIGPPYFEWIDVIEAAQQARDRFVICELGAGWGKWCVRAARVLTQLNPLPFTCIAVEAEPTHFRWMRQHFEDNGIDPDDHDLRWAAVAPTGGVVPFAIGEAERWYGQSIADSVLPPLDARAVRRLQARGVLGRPLPYPASRDTVWVPAFTLWDLIGDEPRIDLLDLDVQGIEDRVLESAAPLIDERVRRVHIGTHTRDIEAALRRIFTRLGWISRVDYECNATAETPYGAISFVDGVQSWLNPRLESGNASQKNTATSANATAPEAPARSAATERELRARLHDLKTQVAELRSRLEKRALRIQQLKTKKTNKVR